MNPKEPPQDPTDVFRCCGYAPSPTRTSLFHIRDLFILLIFAGYCYVWHTAWYKPAKETTAALRARVESLQHHVEMQNRELDRLQVDAEKLRKGDRQTWERAARTRMGWLKKNEVTDVTEWHRKREQSE